MIEDSPDAEEGGADDSVGGDAQLTPFFSPLHITAPPMQNQSRAPVPVLEHILNTVMDALADLFTAADIQSRPHAWGDVSTRHLDVMHVLMEDVHKGLPDATLDEGRLIVKLASMMQFRRGEMLDDHCIDKMLEYLVQATGSKMVGVKGDHTCSPWVTTDPASAGSYYVLGVAYAESLRRLASAPKAKACDKSPVGPAACVRKHDVGESWIVEGEAEDESAVLRRVVRDIAGPENVDAALKKSLDPFGNRNILVAATAELHTTVFRLVRTRVAGPPGQVRWQVCTHDSLGTSKWDRSLQKGMNKLLLSTGLKEAGSNFTYQSIRGLNQGTAVKNTCGFMAFINASQILTGQSLPSDSLAQADCACCVEVIRVFFVLWFIKLGECTGAIRNGYLATVLKKVIDDLELNTVLENSGPISGGGIRGDDGGGVSCTVEFVIVRKPGLTPSTLVDSS